MEKTTAHLFLCQKVFSGINVLLSVIFNETLCVWGVGGGGGGGVEGAGGVV